MRGRRRTLPRALAGTDARTLVLGRGGASLDWSSAREVSDRPHNSKQNVVGLPTAVASALITRNAHVRLLRLILQCALVAPLATRYSANIKWFGGRLAPSLPCHSSRSRSLVKTSSTAASDASRIIWAATSSKTRARRARGGTNLHRSDLLHTRAEVVVAMDPVRPGAERGTLFYRGPCAGDSLGDSKWCECWRLENRTARSILAGSE